METLYVIRDGYPIATIETEDRLNWHFAPTRQGLESGIEISNSFALAADNIDQQIVKNWFTNLLPEGRVREHIVASSKIADNDFSLLQNIGGDCAGALVLSPVFPMREQNRIPRRKLSLEELEAWSVEDSKLELHVITQEKPRMSLAGAQKKWAVIKEDQEFFLSSSDEPSTHIIKAAENHNILLYEVYLNTLAFMVNIRTPYCEITNIGKGLVFSIERYDRKHTDDGVIRMHQEDLCQAQGYPAARKYEKDGGPVFAECIQLIKTKCNHRPSIIDVQELLNWQIFNVICGNNDGHAKNISLLQDDHGEWGLAPSYDLVSTQALQIYNPDLAMAIGECFMPGDIGANDWRTLASACNIGTRKVLKDVDNMLDCIESVYLSKALKQELIVRGFSTKQLARLEQVEHYIKKQIQRIRHNLLDQ